MDVVFSEATAEILSPYAVFWIRMVFAPQPETDTYTASLTRSAPASSHPFTVRAPGTVRIRSWWSCGDDIGYPSLELRCGGTQLLHEPAPYRGGEIVQAVPAPAACEIQMKQWPPDTKTQYRIAITYPH